jgi:toxin CcdB
MLHSWHGALRVPLILASDYLAAPVLLARFDVHRLANGSIMVMDCQSALLDQIDSRFVVPLVPRTQSPPPARRSNPVFEMKGEDYVMLTQAASAVRRRELGMDVGSLDERRLEVTGALDVLIGGV